LSHHRLTADKTHFEVVAKATRQIRQDRFPLSGFRKPLIYSATWIVSCFITFAVATTFIDLIRGFREPLKNVGEVVSSRQKSAKKRSLYIINEHFDADF